MQKTTISHCESNLLTKFSVSALACQHGSSVDRCYGMSVDRCYGMSVDRCYGIRRSMLRYASIDTAIGKRYRSDRLCSTRFLDQR
ncbi:hypothetical protein F2Q68_00006261 [Brassica cretica]|uniref:Uncharacterized protein n=1 Tax=Brassica cretica TaxID=69181 RepID=A0A8S9J973_BRACR|nr:hypothetical protein F2Q68_00006261 [Brassica cretica]